MPKTTYKRTLILLLLTLGLVSILGLLSAQSNSEEYELVRTFALPKAAVPVSELTLEDDIWFRDDNIFSGIAFERFDSGRLARVLSLYRGKQQGPMYVWYPDGAPQVSANYRQGRLSGRYLGWYRNGGVIYDMAINQSGYVGDYISREDAPDSEDILEGEGDSNESKDGN